MFRSKLLTAQQEKQETEMSEHRKELVDVVCEQKKCVLIIIHKIV